MHCIAYIKRLARTFSCISRCVWITTKRLFYAICSFGVKYLETIGFKMFSPWNFAKLVGPWMQISLNGILINYRQMHAHITYLHPNEVIVFGATPTTPLLKITIMKNLHFWCVTKTHPTEHGANRSCFRPAWGKKENEKMVNKGDVQFHKK